MAKVVGDGGITYTESPGPQLREYNPAHTSRESEHDNGNDDAACRRHHDGLCVCVCLRKSTRAIPALKGSMIPYCRKVRNTIYLSLSPPD